MYVLSLKGFITYLTLQFSDLFDCGTTNSSLTDSMLDGLILPKLVLRLSRYSLRFVKTEDSQKVRHWFPPSPKRTQPAYSHHIILTSILI
jgi:hypothetical protein